MIHTLYLITISLSSAILASWFTHFLYVHDSRKDLQEHIDLLIRASRLEEEKDTND